MKTFEDVLKTADKITREEIRFNKKLIKLAMNRKILEALTNNPTKPYEMIKKALAEVQGIKVSVGKLRNMCIAKGLPVRRPEKEWLRTEVKRLTAINDNINEEDF
jgi:hypothetical protein